MKRRIVFLFAIGLQFGGCVACDPPDGLECTQNSDCDGGAVCIETECYAVCTLQMQCDEGEFCSADGVCVKKTTGDGPVIQSVTGNDPADPTRVLDGLIVIGERLASAALEVRGDQGNFGLSVRSATDERIEASFPPNILDGRYTLVAVNGAGEDQTPVELTLPSLTGEELVDRINGINDWSIRLSVSVLPVGTSENHVAAGDHDHAGVYAPVSHDHAGVYAESSHNHDSSYSPIGHNHDDAYMPAPGNWTDFTLRLGLVAVSSTPQYRRVGDEVCLRGWLKTEEEDAIVDGTIVAQLPPGYGPPFVLDFRTVGFGTGAAVRVDGDGNVIARYANGMASLSLTGICFSTMP